jgi:hypothetical protein
MHDTMMHRILERLTAHQLAERVQNTSLPQADRTAAWEMFKKRFPSKQRHKPRQRAWNRA